MKPLAACQLYTFVDTAFLRGRPATEIARQLCAGGADLVQLRAKESTPEEVRRLAESLLSITTAAGVGLVINDHPAIALDVGAPLCHLGQEDFFQAGHRQMSEVVPEKSPLRVGLSTHSPEQAQRALQAGAAYIAVGPVYATGTKPTAKPVTLDYVRWAAANVASPWFAIGGIHLGNFDAVVAAGARRVCVVSAILDAENITRACAAFRNRLDSARPDQPRFAGKS